MDASDNTSSLWSRKFKPLGKVRRRVQDLRIPSSSYKDLLANGRRLDLSHNESSRLAVDCLLSRGLEGYHEVLKAEGEVDFLSESEKNYILQYGGDSSTDDAGESDDADREFESLSTDCVSCSQCSPAPTDSSSTVEGLDQSSMKGVKWIDPIPDDSCTEVFFQTDNGAAGMKDLVRQFIRKAKLALAVVTDRFSDPELLCDLLEASRKRNVSVCLLLDHINLDVFVSMWQDLKLNSTDFPKLSVRSIRGQTYCAKTGRKLKGQIAESFIIADRTDVLTGSYSFSWLSWQVHQSFAVHIKGSSVSHFHQELSRLYSSSKPVSGFVPIVALLQFLCLHSPSHGARNDGTVIRNWKSNLAACSRTWNEEAEHIEKKAMVEQSHDPLRLDGERSNRGNQPVGDSRPSEHREREDPQINVKDLMPQVTECQEQSVSEEKLQHAADSTPLDAGSDVELLEMDQNQIHSHSKLPAQTLQTQRANTDTAERILMDQHPNHQQTPSPTHGQHRNLHGQSCTKVNGLNPPHPRAEETCSWPRNRNMLAKTSVFTSGINTQRSFWNYSLNFYPKVENPRDPKLTGTLQQAKISPQLPFTNSRGSTSRLQTKISSLGIVRHDEQLTPHKPRLHSRFNTESSWPKSAPTGEGAHLRPQLQADSKMFLPGARAKMQHVSVPQTKITPRLNWTQNFQVSGPRAVSRHDSFSGARVAEQGAWKLLQERTNTSLGRSKSMTERCVMGFRRTGFSPN